ncbi:RnfH family protein [Methylomonas sp. MgM2]
MRVEVAYAEPERQAVIAVELPPESTVEQAIQASGILQQFPEIDLTQQQVGIFGALCKLDKPVADGDRVEIYRPLTQSPTQARRERLKK